MRRPIRSPLALILLVVAGFAAACGSSGPSAPTPAALQMACPTDLTIASVATVPFAVTYSAPMVSGGAAPVQTSCAPASGDPLMLGRTPVTCTATDSGGRTATCGFAITLSGFRIDVAKFDAFGDSLTAGEIGRPSIVDPPNAYPTKLQQMLDAVHPGQGMTVINNGIGGSKAAETDQLLRKLLPVDRPDAVLLLTGFNDLTGVCGPGLAATAACGDAWFKLGDNVQSCLRHARETSPGLQYIFVSTLTPPGPTGSNRIDNAAIVSANQRIRQIVAAERAVLVDTYPRFVGHEAEYVNVDGLHLRPAGYAALATAFFDAIQATIPQTPALRFALR